MKLNKEYYLKLIKGDLEWLLKNTERDLERDHIIDIIKASIRHNYPEKEYCDKEFIEWWEDNIGIWELRKKSDSNNIGLCVSNELLDINNFKTIEPCEFVKAHMTTEEIYKCEHYEKKN